MILLILGIIALALLFLVFSAAILNWLEKKFKLENTTFKQAILIVLATLLSGIVIDYALLFAGITEIGRTVAATLISLGIFYLLLNKWYQASWQKIVGIFALFMIISSFLVFPLGILFNVLLVEPVVVVGDSMIPTLIHDDYVWFNQTALSYDRGDIVLINLNDSGKWPKDYRILRVVGLPGEEISGKNGEIKVNGNTLEEPYVLKETTADLPSETLGDNEYLLLPDNRVDTNENSAVVVTKDDIVGKLLKQLPIFKAYE